MQSLVSQKELKEASLALGATHWETIWRVIMPASISGVSTAIILGMSRAIGETIGCSDGGWRRCDGFHHPFLTL
jgi:ABC-type phosphate transport system permease subunit